jgi:O-antigen/teichoic acid export membrane protein
LVNGPNGYAEMGLFNAANQWRMAVLFLPTALGASLMPVLSSLHSEQRRPTYRKVIIINLILAGGISTAIAGAVALASPWISAMYGADFERAAPVIVLLCATAVLISLGNVVGADMAGRGKVWLGVLFCAMVSTWLVGLTWYFAPKYGALGIAIASVIAYSIHTVWLAIYMIISLKRLGRMPAPETLADRPGIVSSDGMVSGEPITK